MRIFITGGAGYLGSALVPEILDKGHEVVVYDLYLYEYEFDEHPNLTQVKGDIRDREKMLEASQDCDVFIHLACISNDPSFDLDPELGKSINFDAFRNVLDAVKENNIKRLIVASSTSQYGVKPLDEDVTEETVAEPITDYAKYKLECEKMVESEDLDADYVFVRPATLCGYAPRLRLDLSVNILTTHALVNKKIKIFGGEQMRPALNIRDMVRFYLLMLEAPAEKISGEAFNVATENFTIREMAEMVKDTLRDEEIEFEVTPTDDKRSYHVNTDKINKVLGFSCKYTIQDAIKSIKEAFDKGLAKDPLENPLYYNLKQMKKIGLK